MPRSVSDHVSDPRHAAPLDGAELVGAASGGDRLLVRIGLWRDAGGRVTRARYRATTCASLIAYAEAACALLEAGAPPSGVTAGALRAAVLGVHPVHLDRADVVAAALQALQPAAPRSLA